MHHTYIDHLSRIESPIHRFDARAKILVFLSFVVFVVLTPIRDLEKFPLYFGLILAMSAAARLPAAYLFKRSCLVLPFVFVIAMFLPFLREGEVIYRFRCLGFEIELVREGLWIFANILVKAYLSAFAMLVLSSTTPFPHILKGLETFGTPSLVCMILSFLYRYLFIIVDEAMRMRQAAEARGVGSSTMATRLKVLAAMIGGLFVRTFDRSERVYSAMISRGFSEKIHTITPLRFTRPDLAFTLAATATWAAVRFLG